MSTPRSRLARVREIFDAALQQPPDRRPAFIADACAGDADLAAELHALLTIDAAAAHEPDLHGVGAAWLAGELGDDLPADLETAPPSIGPFRVLRELGRGAMGIVYEAEQAEPARRVALKLIHPGVIGPSALRRFRRETRAMAALRHPGIVQLFEVGSAELSPGSLARPYLAMELVEGHTLRSYVAETSPSPDQRLGLLALLCDAVHHAHQKGVVHRDLKPENILVQTDAGTIGLPGHLSLHGVQTKILDFGVSRLLESHDTTTVHTIAGQVLGTVPYLSPEQIAGDSEATDTRSDVYTLGVIAFELLAGRSPFDVAHLPLSAALRTITTQDPARLRSVCPSLAPDVETIVHKAMQRDPAQRYQSAADMGADIRRFLAHEPILARRPSMGYVASRFVRRHRALTGVIGVALILLLAAFFTITMLWTSGRRTRDAALWQSYRSAMGAASAAIASGDIASARRELASTPPEHRGWEFTHFSSRLDQSERVLHPPCPAPFAILPEAHQQALLVRPDGVVRIDLSTGALTPHQPDPRLALWHAAACNHFPGPVPLTSRTFWRPDPAAPDTLASFTPASWPEWTAIRIVQACRSTDDSAFALLLGSSDRHAVLFTHFTQPGLSRLLDLPPGERVWRLALAPDATRLLLATSDAGPAPRRLRAIDTRTGATMSETPELTRVVFSMVPRDNGVVTTVLQDGSLESWDMTVNPARRLTHQSFEHDAADNLSLSADGSLLASGSRDGLVRLFDAHTLALRAELFGNDREIVDVHFSADGQHLLSAAQDGSIRLWPRTPPPSNPLVLKGHTHLVHPLVYAPARQEIITGGWDHLVNVHSAQTGGRLATATLDDLVLNLALSPDERLLATRELGGRVRILDAHTLTPVADVDQKMIQMDQPAFDSTGNLLLLDFSPPSASCTVWQVDSRKVDHLPGSVLGTFTGPLLNTRHHLIALTESRNNTRTTVLYNFDRGTEVFATPATRTAIESLAFTPAGNGFAMPDAQNDIVLYSLPDPHPLRRFHGHTREVLAMVFSPDGSRLFSTDLTGVIRIWDTATGDQVGELRGHTAHIRRLIISPDGRLLISGSRDGTARVWSADAPQQDSHESITSDP